MLIKKSFLLSFIIFSSAFAQDKIQGTYSYTYGDNETLVEARQTCKDLALREAIESYYVFVEASTQVENFQTKNDMIESISAGYLQNVTIVEKKEDGKTITITVEATVSSEEVKSIINQLVQDQKEESSTQDRAEVSDDEVDKNVEPESDFISSYENKLSSINILQEQNKYQEAIKRIAKLKSYINKHQPQKTNEFRWNIYKVNYLHISLLKNFLQFKYFKKERKRIKVIETMKLIVVKRNSLQNALNNLKKNINISPKEKIIQKNTLARGRHLINKIKQERQLLREKRRN